MKIIISTKAVVCLVLLLASIPIAVAQNQPDNFTVKAVEFTPGQVWMTDQGITVTILAIEDVIPALIERSRPVSTRPGAASVPGRIGT